ncbi:hypothetical protein CEXT_563171 [Caerostris extrusa]|uniref:Secreted protein n=1 Tax=Caerostris extrusa TaxID=172846 RepID=A0AAV4WX84_CAEEX|nr:hypothetical protein CEXT_563171 [Caerostris extrusa]
MPKVSMAILLQRVFHCWTIDKPICTYCGPQGHLAYWKVYKSFPKPSSKITTALHKTFKPVFRFVHMMSLRRMRTHEKDFFPYRCDNEVHGCRIHKYLHNIIANNAIC